MRCEDAIAMMDSVDRAERNPSDMTPSELLAIKDHVRECPSCRAEVTRRGEMVLEKIKSKYGDLTPAIVALGNRMAEDAREKVKRAAEADPEMRQD